MSAQDPAEILPLDRRRAIFLAVVEAQDGGTAVAQSRAEVARQFGVTEDEVRAIEREGLANLWPPL
jgi:DNA-directed RNA polymerase sigma subunit (sigma70/sigma32)